MSLIPPKTQFNKAVPPKGTHIARVISLVNIGTVEEEYMGEKKKQSKIRITFELPEETHIFKEGDNAKPFTISGEYTLSLGKKSKLLPFLEGIIGTTLTDEERNSFDLEKILGIPCLLSIDINAKGYPVIKSTSKLMKGQVCKEAYNPITKLTYTEWNEDMFQKLPAFIREKMQRSDEYRKMKGIKGDISIEEIPF